MNQTDDKGTPPENPSSEQGGAWLPPRLREKLDAPSTGDDFDFLKKRKSSPIGAIITVVVVVAVIAGAWMVWQNNKRKAAEAAAAKAAAERAVFVADSLARVRMADSLAAVARADSIAFAALPKWKQRQILAEKARKEAAAKGGATASAPTPAGGAAAGGAAAAEGTEAAPAEPAEAGPFGIDVGQYLDEVRAGEKAAEFKEKTGVDARVVPIGEGDEASYHVVLGSYPRRSAAESKANSLLSKGLLTEAAVVALPKAP